MYLTIWWMVWFCIVFTSDHHNFAVRRHVIGCINHDMEVGTELLMRLSYYIHLGFGKKLLFGSHGNRTFTIVSRLSKYKIVIWSFCLLIWLISLLANFASTSLDLFCFSTSFDFDQFWFWPVLILTSLKKRLVHNRCCWIPPKFLDPNLLLLMYYISLMQHQKQQQQQQG